MSRNASFSSTRARIRSARLALWVALVLATPVHGSQNSPVAVPDELLVGLAPGARSADIDRAYATLGAARIERLGPTAIDRIRVPSGTAAQAGKVLGERADVEFVESNLLLPLTGAVVSAVPGISWHLDRIEAPRAWSLPVISPNVIIAILDTGVDAAHPDLSGWLVPGYNVLTGNDDTHDVDGHGTRVAGVAAAVANGGLGSPSTSGAARLMPIKLSATGPVSLSAIVSGMAWAADNGARVLHLGAAGVLGSRAVSRAARYAAGHGAVVLTPAGDCGCADPAPLDPHVVSVSGSGKSDEPLALSSYGPQVLVAAPGEEIVTTSPGGGYDAVAGTSFSSAIAAGVAARMVAANSALRPDEIRALIAANADKAVDADWDAHLGFGRINEYRSVAAAAASVPGSAGFVERAPQEPAASPPAPASSAADQRQAAVKSASAKRRASVKATLLGLTGADFAGKSGPGPDGVPDVQIRLAGVKDTITRVRIVSGTGIWETPFNKQKNWTVAIRPSSDPSIVDLFIDFWQPYSTYTIAITYKGGFTHRVMTESPRPVAPPPPPPPPTPPVPPPPPPPPPSPPAPAPPPVTPWPLPGSPQVSTLASWHAVAPDPAGYSYGFARAHWASRVNQALVFFGNSHNPLGNNSIRAYEPVSGTWTYLWANESHPSQGLQNRDNFSSFYVPTLGAAGELWVWGGSGLETYLAHTGQEAWRAGRFDLATRTWVTKSVDPTSAFAGVVSQMGLPPVDNAMAWCETLNTGVSFGGSSEGGATDRQYIIEPNPTGPEPYRMVEFTGPRPPARAQATNLAACDDNAFYVYGGTWQDGATGIYYNRNDLWRFDLRARTWQQLPSGGAPAYIAAMTYDRAHQAIVLYGGQGSNQVWAFFLQTGEWRNITPAGAPANFNHAAIYAPTADLHIYLGGNNSSGNGSYLAGAVRLDMTGATPPPPPGPVPHTPVTATLLGVTGADLAGTLSPAPDGTPDINIRLSGLAGTIAGVRITSSGAGTWETPINSQMNWGVLIRPTADPAVFDLFFDYYEPYTSYSVTITYSDGWRDTVQTVAAPGMTPGPSGQTPPPPPAPAPASLIASPTTLIFPTMTLGAQSAPQVVWVTNPGSAVVTVTGVSITGDFSGTHDCGSLAPGASCTVATSFTPTGTGTRNGAITIAHDTTGNPLTVSLVGTGTSSQPVPPRSWLPLPTRTWVARPYTTANAPATGGGSKHLRIAHNDANGRVYFVGGDYSSNPGDGSFQNGLWSYDIATGAWIMDYPYCGRPGEIMPGRPDEVGWVWDSKRRIYWILPGFFGLTQSGPGVCGTGPTVATQVQGILTFDPATGRWSNPNVATEPIPAGAEYGKYAVYDPVTDSIYRVRWDGGRGIVWSVFHIAQNSWEDFGTPVTPAGVYVNDAHLDKEYLAADIAGRHIYVIDPNHYRLLRFHMDTRAIEIMAPIPVIDPTMPASLQDFTIPVFDSVNGVLLYPYLPGLAGARPRLLIFHPDTNTWEIDAMFQPEGLTVRGNSAVFDPQQNALMLIGGLSPAGDLDPTLTHFFIYRYGNGPGM